MGGTLSAPHDHKTITINKLVNKTSARCMFNVERITVDDASNSSITLRNVCTAETNNNDMASLVYEQTDKQLTKELFSQNVLAECTANTTMYSQLNLFFGMMRDTNVNHISTGNAITDCIINGTDLPKQTNGTRIRGSWAAMTPLVYLIGLALICLFSSVFPADIKKLEMVFSNNKHVGIDNLCRMPPPKI